MGPDAILAQEEEELKAQAQQDKREAEALKDEVKSLEAELQRLNQSFTINIESLQNNLEAHPEQSDSWASQIETETSLHERNANSIVQRIEECKSKIKQLEAKAHAEFEEAEDKRRQRQAIIAAHVLLD